MSDELSSRTRMEDEWESLWAPYDQGTYQFVLDHLDPDDYVLEIGAGDLRLARQMAKIARQVAAIEIQSSTIDKALDETGRVPENLFLQVGDARTLPFPVGVTAAVLLMRHCQHFHLYFEKLVSAGCRRLITNARWRSGVEAIDLAAPRIRYRNLKMGWYACSCGATGFKPGPVEWITPENVDFIDEVIHCPNCDPA